MQYSNYALHSLVLGKPSQDLPELLKFLVNLIYKSLKIVNVHVPLVHLQVAKCTKGHRVLQKGSETNILYTFLSNFKSDSQNNPTYPLNSAHCFIVYFHEKLFHLFTTLFV